MSLATVDASCRGCGAFGVQRFLSLGELPLPDALLTSDQLDEPEARYPVEVAFCERCSLVQLLHEVSREKMFVDNYLYFSSFSDDVLDHARRHAEGLIFDRDLGPDSFVVEVASNDGYLLQNFVQADIPSLGIDPSPGPAAAARDSGIDTLEEFFGVDLAQRLAASGPRADVIVANNVMAHVPDLDDFVAGLAVLLGDDGVITVENPSVRSLLEERAFDTIYHEHFCYFSCTSVDRLVERHSLHLNHVESFPRLHGGTLRWHISKRPGRTPELERALTDELDAGLTRLDYYTGFGAQVGAIREALLGLLRGLKDQGRTIAAYGAAAKGTVLLNYVGLDSQLLDFVVDRNVHKQGLYMPGVHLPILAPEALLERRPDDTLLLAWNFADEILRQQTEYLSTGGRFIRPLPWPEVLA